MLDFQSPLGALLDGQSAQEGDGVAVTALAEDARVRARIAALHEAAEALELREGRPRGHDVHRNGAFLLLVRAILEKRRAVAGVAEASVAHIEEGAARIADLVERALHVDHAPFWGGADAPVRVELRLQELDDVVRVEALRDGREAGAELAAVVMVRVLIEGGPLVGHWQDLGVAPAVGGEEHVHVRLRFWQGFGLVAEGVVVHDRAKLGPRRVLKVDAVMGFVGVDSSECAANRAAPLGNRALVLAHEDLEGFWEAPDDARDAELVVLVEAGELASLVEHALGVLVARAPWAVEVAAPAQDEQVVTAGLMREAEDALAALLDAGAIMGWDEGEELANGGVGVAAALDLGVGELGDVRGSDARAGMLAGEAVGAGLLERFWREDDQEAKEEGEDVFGMHEALDGGGGLVLFLRLAQEVSLSFWSCN